MGRTADDDETIRKRSGWLFPLSVFVAVLVLSAVFLIYYLAPPASFFSPQMNPTSSTDDVYLSVRTKPFRIPANYLPYASDRSGGDKAEITLFALLPDLTGWSNWTSDAFFSNAPDSGVVYLSLHAERSELTEAGKLARIYMDYVRDPAGSPGPYGLRQFAFREDSGYRNEDLFVGAGPVVLRCVRPSPSVPSPYCLRDKLIAKGVSLSYRFKRAHLAEWRPMAAKIDALIANFQKDTP